MQNITPVLMKLEQLTGEKFEKNPERRAATIAKENMNPVIMAQKERAARKLLQQWNKWGLIKLS